MTEPPRTIRVFPRRTKATPTDARAFIGRPTLWIPRDLQRIDVSCSFTWDKPIAERLAEAWLFHCPDAKVYLGGPAYDDPGGDFEPGMYLRPGYVITSRGCPNHCPHCLVPNREGPLRTLPIRDGYDVLDNNLLACPADHVAAVFDMLRRQPERPRFTGGLEAERFSPEVAEELLALKPDRIFFAYDRPEQLEPLRGAVARIRDRTGWSKGNLRHVVGCYVLVGYAGDTIAEAEERIGKVIEMGPRAFPMFYRDADNSPRPPEWHDIVGGVLAFGGKR